MLPNHSERQTISRKPYCTYCYRHDLLLSVPVSWKGYGVQNFNLTKEQVGWIAAPAFWGFTLAQIYRRHPGGCAGYEKTTWICIF